MKPLEILLADSHVIEILYDSWEPVDIDYKRLFGNRSETASKFITKINEWLDSPYIVDDFGTDHLGARKDWRLAYAESNPEVYHFLNTNVLRRNAISKAMFLELLPKSYFGQNKDELVELISRFKARILSLPNGKYDAWPNVDKKLYVRSLKEDAYKILKFLEGQSQK